MRRGLLAFAIGVLAVAAVILSWELVQGRTFPVGQEYGAVALNGTRFDDRSRTLVLMRRDLGHVIVAYAGCNWFGGYVTFLVGGLYVIRESWMTAGYCGAKNDTEKVFFDALLRTKHWRISGERLVLVGLSDVLQFEPVVKKKEAMQ